MDWNDLRVFLAVAREGSHALAAQRLGVDATTVGRRLTALDQALGTLLFARHKRQLVLTGAGKLLKAKAERMEQEALDAQRQLSGRDTAIQGAVRVTAPDGLLQYVLMVAMPELTRRHPGLRLEFRADARALDLSAREADVALRLARPSQPALVARKLATVRFGLYASADYLERIGSPTHSTDLNDFASIELDVGMEKLPQLRWLQRSFPSRQIGLAVNSTALQVAACLAGHGIALLPTFVAARERRLCAVLPKLEIPTRTLWLVCHQQMRENARVKLVNQWLIRELARLSD